MKTIRFFYLLVFAAALGWGQAVSSLSGVVTDPSGGVVPGATVKIENVAQGLSREAKTDQAGRYAFPQVPPGTYKLTGAKAAGFADIIVNEVILQREPADAPFRPEHGSGQRSPKAWR